MDSGKNSHLDDSPGRISGSPGDSDTTGTSIGETPGQYNPCDIKIDTKLQDVERCEYFINESKVPEKGTHVTLERRDKRCVVLDSLGRTIGTIPASFDIELAPCLLNGYSYAGIVTHSSDRPTTIVTVSIGLKA